MTIKSIPDHVYRLLQRNALLNHRSLNGEAIACLEQSLGLAGQPPEAILEKADALRAKIKGIRLTDSLLRTVKKDGRL